MSNVPVPDNRPRHGVLTRCRPQFNGHFVSNSAFFVHSGSISDVSGSLTGSTPLNFDAYGLILKRIEVFHSGAANYFDISLESATPNTGSAFDPRDIVVEYPGVAGSDNFTCGIDQIEDMFALVDLSGNLYLKVKPHGSGLNDFKYLMFFEAAYVYIE